MSHVKELQHLKISLNDIKIATDNFSEKNYIGSGGYGRVYKGKLCLTNNNSQLVAVKRLDATRGQGRREFFTEIQMLSQYRHENIISLVGFCDEGHEKILVYEFASNGSLDTYLSDATKLSRLSWANRLKICVGVAHGLNYLHNLVASEFRVIHRDIKSANILLDEHWNAKVSDFGLSKIGLANQPMTFMMTNVAGTFAYCDPQYAMKGMLTKESDVYSFGVVLFEVLCGRLAFVPVEFDADQRLLPHVVRTYYKNEKLEEIIDHNIREQIEENSLHKVSAIAYQCLQEHREDRPTTAQVLQELKIALEIQEDHDLRKQQDISWERKLPDDYEEIIQRSDRPLVYSTKEELYSLLAGGILIDRGTKWFSLSKSDKKNCLIISASELFEENDKYITGLSTSIPKSRFSKVAWFLAPPGEYLTTKMHIATEMLSLETTYAVFVICRGDLIYWANYFGYGNGKYSKLRSAERRDDEWMEIGLCHFVNHVKIATFEFVIVWHQPRCIQHPLNNYDHEWCPLYIEGIEFRPIDVVEATNSSEVPNFNIEGMRNLDFIKPHNSTFIFGSSTKTKCGYKRLPHKSLAKKNSVG